MWEMVETVGQMTLQLMENSYLQHIFMVSGSTLGFSKFRSIICGLRCNFYSSLWWKSLTESQQSRVKCDMVPGSISSKVCTTSIANSCLLINLQHAFKL
jgi:hypothetical protein